MQISLTSKNIKDLTKKDVRIAQNVIDAFQTIRESYRNFYATVFLNTENRKVVFKINKGELKLVQIDKLDEGEK